MGARRHVIPHHLKHIRLIICRLGGHAGGQPLDVAPHVVAHQGEARAQLVCRQARWVVERQQWAAATQGGDAVAWVPCGRWRPPRCAPTYNPAAPLTHDWQYGAADLQQLGSQQLAVGRLHLAHQLCALGEERHFELPQRLRHEGGACR